MGGITIKELKGFLDRLPEEFDEYGMVNGEVSDLIDGEYYTRVDKPIISLHIDEETKEFCLFHQSQETVDNVLKNSGNGTTEGPEG